MSSSEETAVHGPVLRANTDFYHAFESLDFDAMCAVWAKDASVVCVHPGWPPLVGWVEVRESWRSIIAGTDYMRIRPSHEQVFFEDTVARVICIENIYTVQQGMAVHSQVAGTNVFRQGEDGEWRLVQHHGSPMGTSAGPEQAEG